MLAHNPLLRDFFSTPPMRELWSEDETIKRWLQTEAAIAGSLAQLQLIPAKTARILEGITIGDINRAQLAEDMKTAGRPIAGLVRQLRTLCEKAGGKECASFVHWGPSTQDIMDTAMMTQARDGLTLLQRQLSETIKHADAIARRYGDIPAAMRTNNQYAMPAAFGDKARGWALELRRRRDLLKTAAADNLAVQLGGAVGMLCESPRPKLQKQIDKLWKEELQRRGATILTTPPGADKYDGKGAKLKKLTAKKMRLPCRDYHWQNARDNIGEIISALALLATSLRKAARNVNALSSSDIGEVCESAAAGKGASSSMPHKQNQRFSEFAEATAQMTMRRAESAGDSSLHDHERSGGAWIAEWTMVPEVFMLSSATLHWSQKMLTDITLNPQKTQTNLRKLLRGIK